MNEYELVYDGDVYLIVILVAIFCLLDGRGKCFVPHYCYILGGSSSRAATMTK